MLRSRFGRSALAVGAVGCLLAGVAACGDVVTDPHDWYAVAGLTQDTQTIDGVQQRRIVIEGPLSVSRNGGAARGTLVREVCIQKVISSSATVPYDCLLVLNAGSKAYAASGSTPAPLSAKTYRLRVLTESTGYIDVTTFGATGRSIHLKLSALPPALQTGRLGTTYVIPATTYEPTLFARARQVIDPATNIIVPPLPSEDRGGTYASSKLKPGNRFVAVRFTVANRLSTNLPPTALGISLLSSTGGIFTDTIVDRLPGCDRVTTELKPGESAELCFIAQGSKTWKPAVIRLSRTLDGSGSPHTLAEWRIS